jgi:hypothetical protein
MTLPTFDLVPAPTVARPAASEGTFLRPDFPEYEKG